MQNHKDDVFKVKKFGKKDIRIKRDEYFFKIIAT